MSATPEMTWANWLQRRNQIMAMNMASDIQWWRSATTVEAAEPREKSNHALDELVRVAQASGPVPLAPEADVMEAG